MSHISGINLFVHQRFTLTRNNNYFTYGSLTRRGGERDPNYTNIGHDSLLGKEVSSHKGTGRERRLRTTRLERDENSQSSPRTTLPYWAETPTEYSPRTLGPSQGYTFEMADRKSLVYV